MAKTKVEELAAGDACLWGQWQGVVDRVELRTLYAKITVPLSDGSTDVRMRRFWRDTGRLVDEYSRWRLAVATPEAAGAATEARQRRALIFALKDYEHWDVTPTADLQEVARILKVKPIF